MPISTRESAINNALDRFWRNRFATAGAIVTILVVLLALAGPPLLRSAGNSYEQQNVKSILLGPSLQHFLGTDILGRDLLARILQGSRISLGVGFVAMLISTTFGVLYGSIAGYFGKSIDETMMRIVDILYSLPYMILVIILLALFERSIFLLFVAIGSVSWLTMARIVRGQVLSLKNESFVEAARASGATTSTILRKHIIPNTIGIVIAYSALSFPSIILQEAFLSFLGLGVQPPLTSWGVLVSEGVQAMAVQPLLIIAPALVMAITLLSLNLIGEGLREWSAGSSRH